MLQNPKTNMQAFWLLSRPAQLACMSVTRYERCQHATISEVLQVGSFLSISPVLSAASAPGWRNSAPWRGSQ